MWKKERKKQQVSSITRETEFQNSVPALTAFSLIPKFYTICSGQKGNLMNKGPTCSTVALSDLSLTRYLGEVKTKCYNLTYGLSTLTEQTVTFCIKDKMTALRSKAFSSYKTKGFSCRQRDGKEKKNQQITTINIGALHFYAFSELCSCRRRPYLSL